MPDIQLADVDEPDPEKLAQQQARLEELITLLPEGHAERGKEIFHNATKSLCITCHVMGDEGVKFGPDLTGIGSIRTEQDLLEAIVYPSSSIARYYELVMVQRKKEAQIAGLILKETADKITLAAAPGAEQPVPLKDIKSAQYSNISLMPQVFDGLLKPSEIADLVAYLISSKIATEPTLPREAGGQPKIPPHRPITVPGLHAYAQKSIAADEEIEFRVSSDVSLQLVGCTTRSRSRKPRGRPGAGNIPRRRAENAADSSRSYVHVENGLPSERRLTQLTLEGWIRPFALSGWQGLITQHDYPESCGIGLFLNNDRIVFITAAGGAFDRASLHETKPGLIKPQPLASRRRHLGRESEAHLRRW